MEYVSLSRRHIACLALIASGKDARESAVILGLPLCEIEENLEEARLRLGVGSVQSAANVVEMLGLAESSKKPWRRGEERSEALELGLVDE